MGSMSIWHWIVVIVLTIVGWTVTAFAMRQYRARGQRVHVLRLVGIDHLDHLGDRYRFVGGVALRARARPEVDDLDPVGLPRQSQSQILNNHSVFSFLNETLCFFYLTRCVNFESVLRKILTHRKTDRLFIVHHQQISRARFNVTFFRYCLSPAAKQFSKTTGHSLEVQHYSFCVISITAGIYRLRLEQIRRREAV